MAPSSSKLIRGKVDRKETNSYNGVLHRFSFATNKNISISGVTFLGLPKTKEKAVGINTSVDITIKESAIFRDDWTVRETLMPEQNFKIRLEPEKTVFIQFSQPIQIRKETAIKTQTLNRDIMEKTTLVSEDGFVAFDITWSRYPLQLSELHFTV